MNQFSVAGDAARSAESGSGKDVDVPQPRRAVTIPVGMLYLLFAPFPWQLGSLRQSPHPARDDYLVGIVLMLVLRFMVFNQVSVANDLSHPDFHP